MWISGYSGPLRKHLYWLRIMNYLGALSDRLGQTQLQTANLNQILDCKEAAILGGSPHCVLYLLPDRPSQRKVHKLFTVATATQQIGVRLRATFCLFVFNVLNEAVMQKAFITSLRRSFPALVLSQDLFMNAVHARMLCQESGRL